MSRKRKGYFVQGAFVEHGSEADQDLRAEHADSRTAAKRRVQALQDLGEALLALKETQIKGLPGSVRLIEALLLAKTMPRREARRRQVQYIGKLMRSEDAAELEQALQVARDGSAQEQAAAQMAEQWRSRLLEDDAAVQEWVAAYPQTDVQRLRSLIRQVRRDRQRQEQAAASQDDGGDTGHVGAAVRANVSGSAFRELFRLLKRHLAVAQEG